MIRTLLILTLFFSLSCKDKIEKTKPSIQSISESIYASGIIKSKNQYQAFSSVNGIVDSVYVSEGDTLKKGDPILSISSETQQLNRENAELTAAFSDLEANQGKLSEARLFMELASNKMKNDSIQLFRQKNLLQQEVGTKLELEQRELAYQNSKTNYLSSIVKYNDLKRQLTFTSSQSKKNFLISSKIESDYTLKSEINGVVFSLNKTKGELISAQTPLAIIGDAKKFILEMQVDEYDVLKIKKGLIVLVSLDSYKGKAFEATITKINPFMNERSKTFIVEAEFVNQPDVLYPNISFEANILIRSKENALLIPRKYLINDSMVITTNKDTVVVKTGLKDYQKIEILSGISSEDELIKPSE